MYWRTSSCANEVRRLMAIAFYSDKDRHRLAHDIAKLSAEICLKGSNDPGHMISRGVATLSDMAGSTPTAMAWMEHPTRNDRPSRMLHFVSSNGEHSPQPPGRACYCDCPVDFIENAKHDQLCFRRSDVTPDDEWRDSPMAQARAASGLYDYVRAITSCTARGEPRLLHIELAGRCADWRPSDYDLDLICAASTIMCAAYIHRKVLPDEARLDLLARLTPSQRQVAMLLTENVSEAEIASIIQRSPHTVHDHVKAVFRAWGVHSRAETIALWRHPLDPFSSDSD